MSSEQGGVPLPAGEQPQAASSASAAAARPKGKRGRSSGPSGSADTGDEAALSGQALAGEKLTRGQRDHLVRKRRKAEREEKATEEARIPLDPVEVEISPSMRNLSRWHEALGGGLRLTKVRQPTAPSGRIVLIREILSEPPQPNRSWEVESVEWLKKDGHWALNLLDGSSKFNAPVPIHDEWMCTQAFPDMVSVRKLGESMCKMLNRLPIAVIQLSNHNSALAGIVENAALALSKPGFDWASQPLASSRKGRDPYSQLVMKNARGHSVAELSFRIKSWCPDGSTEETKTAISLPSVRLDVTVPDLPNSVVSEFKHTGYVEGCADEDKPKWDQARKLAMYTIWRVNGAIGPLSAVKQLRNEIMQPFLKKTRASVTTYGPYGGNSPLWAVDFSVGKKSTFIRPATAPVKDVAGSVPAIELVSLSRTKVAWVLSLIQDKFLEGKGFLNAWQAGVVGADLVNIGQITSDDIRAVYCMCADDERIQQHHVCMMCLKTFMCHEMQLNHHHLTVCRHCALLDPSESSDTKSSQKVKKTSVPRFRAEEAPDCPAFLWQHLYTLTKTDAQSAEDRHQLRLALWDSLRDWYDPDTKTWRDYATSKRRSDPVPGVGHEPLVPSIEAILPIYVADGKTRYHHPGNIGILADYANRMKYTWLPYVLPLTKAVQVSRRAGDASMNEVHHDKFDCVYALSLEYDIYHTTRTNQPMTSSAFEERLRRWRALKLPNLLQSPWLWRTIASVGRSGAEWSPEDRDDIAAILKDIETRYNFRIERAPDGAPWLWRKKHMPKDWSWLKLWEEFALRVYRMRVYCNKYWATLDTPKTMILECAIQYAQNKGKDAFLGVELTVLVRHPLCFGIGHKHHGKQMRTGWKVQHPKSLDDYDADQCNILFESQLSNKAKFCYPEETYQAMLDDIVDFNDVTDYWEQVDEFDELVIPDSFSKSKHIAVDEVEDEMSENEGDDEDNILDS